MPGCTPCADTCLLQELIYKEFFSQGDLVGTTWQGWAWPMCLESTEGMGALGSEQRGLSWEWGESATGTDPACHPCRRKPWGTARWR